MISDYSVLIKGIPGDIIGIKTRLGKLFEREFEHSPRISQITFAPDLEELEKMQHRRSELINKKVEILRKFTTDDNRANAQE